MDGGPMSQIRQSAFHEAARSGYSDRIMTYLQAGGIQLEKTENGRSPLLSACTNGHTNVAKVLIYAGANIHACDPEDFCCIHAAALGGFVKVIELLLAHGADIEALDNLRSTPLHAATLRSHPKAMRYLIQRGANISPRTVEYHTPLLLTCSVGFTDAARVLLELGANPMERTSNGDTCLLLAISSGFIPIAEMLIAAGAEPNHQGSKHLPVLNAAGGTGSRRILTALLRAGADPSAVDGVTAGTALARAAEFARPVAARLLLQAGALETAVDSRGLAPIELIGSMLPPSLIFAESVGNAARSVRHALQCGPAFRARSWLWPANTEDIEGGFVGGEGGGERRAGCCAGGDGGGGGAAAAAGVVVGKWRGNLAMTLCNFRSAAAGTGGGRGGGGRCSLVALSAMTRYAGKT